jgi:hypothetical protein
MLFDPEGAGIDDATNKLCGQAHSACEDYLSVFKTDVSLYNIRVTANIEPPADYQEYLNTPAVMQSIGAQVNYTDSTGMILRLFSQSKSLPSIPLFHCIIFNPLLNPHSRRLYPRHPTRLPRLPPHPRNPRRPHPR